MRAAGAKAVEDVDDFVIGLEREPGRRLAVDQAGERRLTDLVSSDPYRPDPGPAIDVSCVMVGLGSRRRVPEFLVYSAGSDLEIS